MQLFPYQEEAVTQQLHHRSALNGDDMGLGKTVEAIALDVRRRELHNCKFTAQTLVVTMTSVMGGWEAHYNEWAPDLKVIVLDRKNRNTFIDALTEKDGRGLPVHHVFVCHWASLRFIAEELKGVSWFHIIGDEIQSIKNREAQQTQAFKKLKTYYKTGLSGTWADNRPDDAWSPLNWLWPEHFTSYWNFYNHHVLQKRHDAGHCQQPECFDKYHRNAYTEIVGVHDQESIHAHMGEAYVRRTKEQVLKDLPEKIFEDRPTELGPLQRKTYDLMRHDMLTWVGEHEDQPVAAPVVIAQLIRLQQFACAYGKLEVMYKNVEVDEPYDGFDEDGNPQRKLRRVKKKVPYKTLVLDEPSSKLDAVMEIVEQTNEKVVVFAQSKQVINLLAARLVKAKIPAGILTGDTAQKDRDLAISQFQSGGLRVFASTIKAGGIGITLTAASTAVFIDWDWSPSKNKQAEDRIHRVGQKNACQIIRLVARDTIDRKRNDKIAMKWEWLKSILEPPKKG